MSPSNLLNVDFSSHIPLFGLDFIGIVDRATNVLEIKPITVCNLRCKYCFVSAGDYVNNFSVDANYMIEWVKRAIQIKQAADIEIHIAPYGEILLYTDLDRLILGLRALPEISTISIQTNGLLLSQERVQHLAEIGVDRLNISLNSMDAAECAEYCGVERYDLAHLLQVFDWTLASPMDLLIAPVWFRGVNDQGIHDIIAYIQRRTAEGLIWPKLRLGIQNYLTYKTGRKIRKTKMRDFSFFYKTLRELEHAHGLKLKLGPHDFNIHKTGAVSPPARLNEIIQVEIIHPGRFENEYIGIFGTDWAVKVLSPHSLEIGNFVRIKLIRSNLHGNLLTGVPV